VKDGQWIPLVKSGRERSVTRVEEQLNAWVNTPVLGSVLRSFWLFFIAVALVPIVAPLQLLASLISAAYQAYRNRRHIDPRGRVVVITGCDSGFGFAAALHLAQQGFLVVAGCLRPQGMTELTETWKSRAREGHAGGLTAVQCDVTKDGERRGLLEATEKLLERSDGALLHAVINNAGIGIVGDVETTTEEAWNKILAVNVVGVAQISALFVPLLREAVARDTEVSPRIITVTSQAGFATATPGAAGYQASKWAAQALTQTMNIELEPSGISVCTINPSFHRTPIFKNTYSGVLESSMDDQDKTKAILSAKTLTCLASQHHWDPQHVVNAMAYAVQGYVVDPVIPVGLDACMLLQPMASLPFTTYKFLMKHVIVPAADAMAKDTVVPPDEYLKSTEKRD